MLKGWGDLFTESLKEYFSKFMTLLKLFSVLYLLPLGVILLVSIIIVAAIWGSAGISGMATAVTGGEDVGEGDVLPVVPMAGSGAFFPVIIVLVVVAFIVFLVMYSLLNLGYIQTGFLPKGLSMKEAFKSGARNFWRYIGLSILLLLIGIGLLVPGGLVVLLAVLLWGSMVTALKVVLVLLAVLLFIGGFLFTVWIGTHLVFSVYALVKEGVGIVESMRQSWRIVKGSFWRVFGFNLLLGVVMAGFSLALSIVLIPFSMIGAVFPPVAMLRSLISNVFNYLFLVPFSIFFIKNFYLNMKENMRKAKK